MFVSAVRLTVSHCGLWQLGEANARWEACVAQLKAAEVEMDSLKVP